MNIPTSSLPPYQAGNLKRAQNFALQALIWPSRIFYIPALPGMALSFIGLAGPDGQRFSDRPIGHAIGYVGLALSFPRAVPLLVDTLIHKLAREQEKETGKYLPLARDLLKTDQHGALSELLEGLSLRFTKPLKDEGLSIFTEQLVRYAFQLDNAKGLEVIIKLHGTPFTSPGTSGHTWLSLAAQSNALKCSRLLLEQGADPTVRVDGKFIESFATNPALKLMLAKARDGRKRSILPQRAKPGF